MLDPRIRAEFGYAEADDRGAASELAALVPSDGRFRDAAVEVRNRRNVVILGCGPGLARVDAALLSGQVVVAADGACTRLRELGVVPNLVVTDLDGRPEDLRWAADQGAIMVVHAHGDNRPALQRLVPHLGPRTLGTHQVLHEATLEPLREANGFTDGDRAVVLCEELGARNALLAGFEFEAAPSHYSNHFDARTKPRKLAWARQIVGDVQARGKMALRLWQPAP